jgi:hypothetical protein
MSWHMIFVCLPLAEAPNFRLPLRTSQHGASYPPARLSSDCSYPKTVSDTDLSNPSHSQCGSSMSASLSHLMDQLYALLPRELRNEIYSYLWADSVLDAFDIQLFPVARVKDTPEFARTLVVGTEIAREAVEWLYANETFTVQSPSQIRAFLEWA